MSSKVLNACDGGKLCVTWHPDSNENFGDSNRRGGRDNYPQNSSMNSHRNTFDSANPNAHLWENSAQPGANLRRVDAKPSEMGSDAAVPPPSAFQAIKKYTARIDIGLQNDGEFQVARKLIGVKGANMKKIVAQTNAKLRLRGRDSGYMEGMTRQESNEPLHLCISCTNHTGYQMAKKMSLDIVQGMYREYQMFKENQGIPLQFLPTPVVTEHPVIHSTAERIQQNQQRYFAQQQAARGGPNPNYGYGAMQARPGKRALICEFLFVGVHDSVRWKTDKYRILYCRENLVL